MTKTICSKNTINTVPAHSHFLYLQVYNYIASFMYSTINDNIICGINRYINKQKLSAIKQATTQLLLALSCSLRYIYRTPKSNLLIQHRSRLLIRKYISLGTPSLLSKVKLSTTTHT